ncbi:hypothetical protein [Mycolicibacterium sp. XJ1819]
MAAVIQMNHDRRRAGKSTPKSDPPAPMSAVERRAEEAFWKSPPGQAVQAYDRGDEFFQLQLPHSAVRYEPLGAQPRHGLTHRDVLGQIEEAGWHLEHAAWMPDPSGEVGGMYLFRRDENRRRR